MSVPPTRLEERPAAGGGVARYELTEWREAYGVVAGITARGASQDFVLSGPTASPRPWDRLHDTVGRERFESVVAGRQVHGSEIALHRDPQPGVRIGEGVDGHATARAGVLLAVTVADCVPIYLLDPAGGGLALLHAGWRGVAAGILERGIESLASVARCAPGDIVMHCGVSICGDCYEVGPEVVRAVTGREALGPTRLDLRDALLERAARSGLARVTASSWCAAHDASVFWSHRGSGGRAGRMAAYLGRPLP